MKMIFYYLNLIFNSADEVELQNEKEYRIKREIKKLNPF